MSDSHVQANEVERINGYSQDFYFNTGNPNEYKNKKQKKYFQKLKRIKGRCNKLKTLF